jgi:hypothetical protein
MIASPADAGKSPATQTQQGRFVFIGCLPGKLNFRFDPLNNRTRGGGYRQIARMDFPMPVKKSNSGTCRRGGKFRRLPVETRSFLPV